MYLLPGQNEESKNNSVNQFFAAESKKIDDFDDYMFHLRPETNKRNPWFKEYWHKLTGCPAVSQNKNTKSNNRFCGKVCFSYYNLQNIFPVLL